MNKSNLQFKGYRIQDSQIKMSPEVNAKEELKLNFILKGEYKKDGKFILGFDTEILNNDKSLYINIKSQGLFECETEDPKDPNFVNILALNAPAILFPYIRAYISTLTALSGLDPITLPTLNLSRFKDNLAENIHYSED
jgi:preprotein translocase subunit SecB